MLAKKRAQVESDRVKAHSFRDERVPLLSRLGEVDHLVRKYDWAVETGAVEVVEMMEKMAREKAEDRRRQIAVEARGKQPYRAIASPDVAGPSRVRPASPRGNAPRAISSPSGKYVGTIPKFRDRGSVAQEERARHRQACGYRGGSGSRNRSQSRRGGAKGQRRSSQAPAPQLCRAEGCQWGQGGEPPTTGPWEQGRGRAERQAHGP